MEKFVAVIKTEGVEFTMQGKGDAEAARTKLQHIFRPADVSILGFGEEVSDEG
jgi:hypothetical protein